MGFLRVQVALRGNQEAANTTTTGGEKRDWEETFQGSSLNRLRAWSRFWQACLDQDLVGTGTRPPKMEARDQGLQI